MCDPVTAILATTSILGGVQADRNASKQRKAYRQAAQQEQKEINRSNSITAQNKAKAARNAKSRIKARAAGSGASGLSIDSLLNNSDMQIGTDLAVLEGNNELAVESSQQRLKSNINSVQGADWLNVGLQIGGAAYANNSGGG